ncbi:MAG: tRNA 2-thiouridine(34) synthase MnmA [Bacteroidetes bacterium]|nr:tRNA 2-thiouridine(34) synthase MnmA [Bacteroidota bacterium]MCL5738075.1 tRNA 2-thiouridine(34) synthase MnmA [Bacteroidota bacterium]
MINNVEKPRVVAAMSGGVDSSLAAVLMLEQGYDVVGVTIKTYDYEDVGGNDNRDSSCCSIDGINMARSVASKYNFPHYVFDFSERFKREVIDEFVAEYLAGRTPNPCVICNRKIKWEYLLEKANSLGADYICTGHYAKVRFDGDTKRYVLSRGSDTTKDQSYALYGLTQESLSKTIFPLAEMTKPEVRELSSKFGLASADKPESYEICFVADNDYTRFLRDSVPGLESRIADGEIVLDGKSIGKHHGYAFYTIGQRKGLGISYEKPLYVKGIDANRNVVEVDVDEKLYAKTLVAERVNMVKYSEISEQKIYKAKIRYKDGGASCFVRKIDGERMEVEFVSPRRAITPGQSVVVYENDDVVAGGIISSVLN